LCESKFQPQKKVEEVISTNQDEASDGNKLEIIEESLTRKSLNPRSSPFDQL